MVLKRNKAHKKQAKQQPTFPAVEPYSPPPRDQLEAESWKEYQDNGDWFEVQIWYYPKKGNTRNAHRKTADFYLAYRTKNGSLIASADCSHHGTFHLHDELNDPDHTARKDAMILQTAADVESAFLVSRTLLRKFVAKLLNDERGRGNEF